MSDQLVLESLIYESPDGACRVMRGAWQSYPVAVKILQYSDKVWKEVQIQQSLCCLDGVCKIYQTTIQQDTGNILLILELMDKDMFMEIEDRKIRRNFWSESELWEMFRRLVDILAYAQSVGISHRDIKPQNIFLSSSTLVKIGDFGCAKSQFSETSTTILGSPYFFSPEIKQFYQHFMTGVNEPRQYNAYKSDVYSLGMTFLMMTLLMPSNDMMDLMQLEQATVNELAKVPYDSIRTLLGMMLQILPENRCDFLQLKGYIDSLFYDYQQVTVETISYALKSPDFQWLQFGLQHLFRSQAWFMLKITVYKRCEQCGGTLWLDLMQNYTLESLEFCSLPCYYQSQHLRYPGYQQQTPFEPFTIQSFQLSPKRSLPSHNSNKSKQPKINLKRVTSLNK